MVATAFATVLFVTSIVVPPYRIMSCSSPSNCIMKLMSLLRASPYISAMRGHALAMFDA